MKWEPVKEGPKSLVAKLNLLGELVTRNMPIEGRGVRITSTKGGYVVDSVSSASGFKKLPFTLETYLDEGTLKLRCHYGRIGKTSMLSDSGGGEVFAFNYVNTTIGGLDLADHPAPIAGTEGALTLSASTTYGVWIKVDVRKSSWRPYTAPGSDTVNSTLVEFSTAHASSIVIDSTHTAESQAATLTGTTSGFAYIYVGKVVVDGSSVATITQHLRSDVLLPATLYPYMIISSDADNSLGNGSDGGIYVRTVSGDTDNSITPGSDGGAYLADDDFMTGLTQAGGITVSDNGDGTWEVDDS